MNDNILKMRILLWCGSCKKYTMNESCSCGNKTINIKPLKYSPDDNLSDYRRNAKMEEYIKRELI